MLTLLPPGCLARLPGSRLAGQRVQIPDDSRTCARGSWLGPVDAVGVYPPGYSPGLAAPFAGSESPQYPKAVRFPLQRSGLAQSSTPAAAARLTGGAGSSQKAQRQAEARAHPPCQRAEVETAQSRRTYLRTSERLMGCFGSSTAQDRAGQSRLQQAPLRPAGRSVRARVSRWLCNGRRRQARAPGKPNSRASTAPNGWVSSPPTHQPRKRGYWRRPAVSQLMTTASQVPSATAFPHMWLKNRALPTIAHNFP